MRPLSASSIALAILLAGCLAAQPGELEPHFGNLEGEWLFSTDPGDVGEKENWASTDFDDSEWRTLRVPGYWEGQGVTDPRPGQPPKPKNGLPYTDYDGVAWYRLRFEAPAGWEGEGLVLTLGSVDDYDRTYVNGELVGETARTVQQAVSTRRAYEVSEDLLNFGGENVIALRVFDGGGPGGFMGPLVTLLPTSLMERATMIPAGDRPLEERFVDPPGDARILKIIHGWPDDPQAQDALITGLASQGFGGVVSNISFTEYLESEEMWEAFLRAVGEAKDAGMAQWLYDEKGYPSGAAGGIVLRDHPEWEARGLLVAEATSTGGEVTLDVPPGKLHLAAAYPVRDDLVQEGEPTDLSDRVADGKLTWTAPDGDWWIAAVTEDYLYEGTHAAHSLAEKLSCTNLLMPEPTERFIEVTHAAYAARMGDDLPNTFIATFTDEPSLMNVFLRPMPYAPLPWAPDLPREFTSRRGYELAPHLPSLVTATGSSAKVRHDFWLTVGELLAENYFRQIEDYCREHNIPSGGHLIWEESIVHHVGFYGDFFRCLRELGAPSMDCLTSIPSSVPWFVARMVGSAADLEGRRYTMSETSDHVQRYRPEGDDRPVVPVGEDEIRGTCNRQMLGGINTITSYYSFTGLTTQQLRRLNEWVGRCCTVLRGGHQVTDIAVLYPVETLWTRFEPAKHRASDSPGAAAVEQAFNAVSTGLYNARRDFTYIDARTLAEGSVENGALVHGDMRWRVVVLPCVDTLPDAAWLTLQELLQQGGVVIAVGARPTNSAREFPSPRIVELGREMLGEGDELQVVTTDAGGCGVHLPTGASPLLPGIVEALIGPDVAVADPASLLRVAHRRVDGHEVYFLINDSADPVEETVDLAVAGSGEQWDPATGEMTPLQTGQGIKLSLQPYGGMLLRFAEYAPPERKKLEPGELPGMELTSLPEATPTEGHGEFVEGSIAPDDDHEGAWRAVGKLTKSDVDTHLFTSFRYPQGLDLAGAISLVVDTWVPEGQATSAYLLVMLHEPGGGIYLANTGRPLSAAGHVRSYVPLSGFDLAGWSEDENGRLDPGKVEAISVGWGGYFGKEGETVEFSLALPEVARRK